MARSGIEAIDGREGLSAGDGPIQELVDHELGVGIEDEDLTQVGPCGPHQLHPVLFRLREGPLMGEDLLAILGQPKEGDEALPRELFAPIALIILVVGVDRRLLVADQDPLSQPFL